MPICSVMWSQVSKETRKVKAPLHCVPVLVGTDILEASIGEHGINKARGPSAGRGVFVPGRPQDPGVRCDVKCESEQEVTGAASGRTVPTGPRIFCPPSPHASVLWADHHREDTCHSAETHDVQHMCSWLGSISGLTLAVSLTLPGLSR
ncbi:hypothetical protein EYF80_014521 [Liparis tanakae]|uniref:Uncharacterized protein n=1 Tax=Liparis tanakae TaxID=230148 RepID=A0A4Z2ID43_9TELE|nr:hypothetical protein EYF80_014521 [Liparis tanakae]